LDDLCDPLTYTRASGTPRFGIEIVFGIEMPLNMATPTSISNVGHLFRASGLSVLGLLGPLLLSACSCQSEIAAKKPIKQEVATSDVNALLQQGAADNIQIAEQLARIKTPFEGKVALELNLSDTQIEDEDLRAITLPDSLTRVNLTRTYITDEGLEHLTSGKNITELILVDTPITAAGLKHLRAMPQLRKVQLHQTKIPVKDQLELQKFLHNRDR
jgi:hypothetical protein